MQQIIIANAKPYDGRYDLDLTLELTTREWGWIKRYAGYLPLGLGDDAFGDPELVCVLAVIAMRRAGRIAPNEVPGVYEKLADTPFGTAITIQGEPDPVEEGDDGRPPPISSSSNASTSGDDSPTSSETSDSPPKRTGTPGSDISASAPLTSVS